MDVLLDANVIIDLIEWGCFDGVLGSAAFCFWVVENVKEEIVRPRQRAVLDEQLRRDAICQTRVESLEELRAYAEFRMTLADGEAASLAVAAHRGWAFVTYEKGRTKREALRLLGHSRYLRTPQLLASVIEEGAIALEELDAALAMLVLGSDPRTAHLRTVLKEVKHLLESARGN